MSTTEVNKIYNADPDKMNELWTKHINYGYKYQQEKGPKFKTVAPISREVDKDIDKKVDKKTGKRIP